MTDSTIKQARELSERLAEPYIIPDECPYLSEDQRELSKLPFEKRAEWWAEWFCMDINNKRCINND